jgi:hypothetical protein
MLVLSQGAMTELMRAVVECCISLTDTAGKRAALSTIPADRLKLAAITAVSIAVGEAVWPADQKIVIKRQTQIAGPFEIEG